MSNRQERRARRQARRETRRDDRRDRREERRDGRRERRDERQEGRQERRDERREFRDERRDARREARDDIRDIRRADLTRQERRDAIRDERDERRDAVDASRQERRDDVARSRADQRDAVRESRQDQRAALQDIRVPKAARNTWKSYLDFQKVQAVEIYKPKTLGHLRRISELAADNDLTIKAIGSGHSFSEIGQCDGYFVLTDQMDRMLPFGPEVKRGRLKPVYHDDDTLFEVEVGITIIELSEMLEEHGRALFNQGTYDGQTLWGAVSTSTHGSGIDRPPFPDMIRSIVVVGEEGRVYRIEPRQGITDPNGWNEPDIDELIQDDRVFYSQICSFGSMGVTYSAVIETRAFYWMNEWTAISTWDTFKAAFQDPADLLELLEQWDTFELLVMPVRAEGGKKDGVELDGEYPISLCFRSVTDDRRVIGGNTLDRLAKALEGTIIDGPGRLGGKAEGRWGRPKMQWFYQDNQMPLTAIKNLAKQGWDGGDLDPETWPINRRNKCYKLFPKGGKLFGGYGVELAFPVEQTIPMMDRIIELAEENDDDDLFHTAPVAVRFVAPSKAYASPQFEQPTVMLEVLMAKGTKDGPFALKHIEREMLEEPGCRVHWGLHLDEMDDINYDFRAAYPRWDAFVETFETFNQLGTFENDFTDRIGLSQD